MCFDNLFFCFAEKSNPRKSVEQKEKNQNINEQ